MNSLVIWFMIIAGALAVMALLTLLLLRMLRWWTDLRTAAWQADLMARHMDEVQNIYRQMRGWRHDYHNHIQTMKALLELDRHEELAGYLEQLDSDLTRVDTVLKTGNVKMDAILNSKLSLITAKGIAMNAKAKVPEKLPVADTDLCVILGNLLDNALESCLRVEDPQLRFLRVYISARPAHLYISITNATQDTTRRIGSLRSNKGKEHGFGLIRIDTIVARCGGTVNRQNEPGVFVTEVLLPL